MSVLPGTRLMIAAAGKEPTSFVNTNEEISGPLTAAGPGTVAFLIGTEPQALAAHWFGVPSCGSSAGNRADQPSQKPPSEIGAGGKSGDVQLCGDEDRQFRVLALEARDQSN